MELVRRKSDFKAKDRFDFAYLMQKRNGLLPCLIKEEDEELIFVFDKEDIKPFSKIRLEDEENRYRFLSNLHILRDIFADYEIQDSEENIFYDENFIPCIAIRDIKRCDVNTVHIDNKDEEAFLLFCKQIVLSVLCKDFTYQQIKESGISITQKDKNLKEIVLCEDSDSLFNLLRSRADKLHLDNRDNRIRIDRKSYRRSRVIYRILVVILSMSLLISLYFTLIRLPQKEAVIRASREFVTGDYVGVITNLERLNEKQMDTYAKYILAISYARGEALEREELKNVIDKISIYSNDAELMYWITLGRGKYLQAQNYAKALSDDKLLIYAYMKELTYLESNVSMDGEEKQERISTLDAAIKEIGKKYMEVE